MVFKSRKIKTSIFWTKNVCAEEAVGERKEQKSEACSVNFPSFRMGRTYSVLCLSREHILINLSQDHCPLQWQKPCQASYLHIKVWVRMVPVPLFLILFCGKCNAEMINLQRRPSSLSAYDEVKSKCPSLKLWNGVKVQWLKDYKNYTTLSDHILLNSLWLWTTTQPGVWKERGMGTDRIQ